VRAIHAPEVPLPAGVTRLTDDQKYVALYIIRHHVHPDLKYRGKGTAKPSLTKLSFATSVDATRTPLTSASPQHLAIICSNPMAATHLEGKGFKPTSTFIQMAPMELVVRVTFLLDLAPP
jgi:hypothetical protein